MKNKIQLPVAGALMLIVFALAVVIYNEQKTDDLTEAAKENASYLMRDYSPRVGNKNAKVTIVEFFDPACETCKAFHPFVKHLMSKHPGKIKVVARYLPLHQGSDYVVKILEAAKLQNKFWETLEATYEAQPAWASHNNPQPKKLWRYIGGVGLDMKKARKDMQSQTTAKHIQQDLEDARQLKVSKTPGFFVNGKPLVHFGYDQLQALVESEIKNSY